MALKTIELNPRLLIWAREKSHLSKSDVARYIGTSENRYNSFESGESAPTLRQFFKISNKLNRPAQYFFLNEIPPEHEPLTELRRLPGSIVGDESPALVKQVKLATEYRNITLGLLSGLGIQPININIHLDIDMDPEIAANSVRDAIKIPVDKQATWQDGYEALRTWRSAVEQLGVLVFQMPGIELSEMRGLSINLRPLPIIGINSRDYENPRVFTLFHELIHVLTGEMVLDSHDGSWFNIDSQYMSEHFCNRVAANILVPKTDLSDQVKILQKSQEDHWEDRKISILSKRYSVSKQVIIRRLLTYDLISNESFQELDWNYRQNIPAREKQDGGSPYNNMMSRLGTFLPQLAFRSYYENRITSSDLSSLFGLKVENLPKMEERVFSSAYQRVV